MARLYGGLIDPLQDLDGVVLDGPRMTETSQLTVLVQSPMEDAKLRGVMEQLGGEAGRGARGRGRRNPSRALFRRPRRSRRVYAPAQNDHRHAARGG